MIRPASEGTLSAGPAGAQGSRTLVPSLTTRRSATRPATTSAGKWSTGAAPLARAWRTRPRAWRALPSYGGWVVLTPAEPIAGSGVWVPPPVPGAAAGGRALGTARYRTADGGAEVHQRLVPRPGVAGRDELVGERLHPRRRQPLAGDTGEQAGDVRLDDCVVALEGEDADCPSGVRTDAGQGAQVVEVVWDVAAVAGDDPRCGVVEVACPPRVAESLPQAQDVTERRRGARRRRRVGGQEGAPLRVRLARPASAAASPRRRGSPTGRGWCATAGRGVAAPPRRARLPHRATPRPAALRYFPAHSAQTSSPS